MVFDTPIGNPYSGQRIIVSFINGNTAATPTINGSQLRVKFHNGTTAVYGGSNRFSVGPMMLEHDGTYWIVLGNGTWTTMYHNTTGIGVYGTNGVTITNAIFNCGVALVDGDEFKITMMDSRSGHIQRGTIAFEFGKEGQLNFDVTFEGYVPSSVPYLGRMFFIKGASNVNVKLQVAAVTSNGNTAWFFESSDIFKIVKIEKLNPMV